MSQQLRNRYRSLADAALEYWMPRICTQEWLLTVAGPTRFQWDLETLQAGLLDPLYEFAAARPERLRPILTAAVLESAGLDPSQYSSLLAAIELQFLADVMVKDFYNGKTLATATPTSARRPLSVTATSAYTARQFAPTLAAGHSPNLKTDDRSWLAYRFGRVLILAGVGATVSHLRWNRDHKLMNDESYVEHLRGFASPLTFEICIDCAIAALGVRERAEFVALQRAASVIGVAYQAALEANNWNQDLKLHNADPKVERSYLTHAAVQDGKVKDLRAREPQAFVQIARRELLAAERISLAAPAQIRETLFAFAGELIDPLLNKFAGVAHAH